MKTQHLSLIVAAGGLLFGPLCLLAQEQPQSSTPPPLPAAENPKSPPAEGSADNKPKPPPPDRHEGERHHRGDSERHGMMEHRGPEMKPTPFIGVMTRGLSPEVRAQTGLQEGFGLLVEDVLPDSPAKTAGLLQHDVLVLLGDQRLVNTEQLAALVRASGKDSELIFTIRRAGMEQKVTVKVGERLMPPMTMEGGPHWPGHPFDGQRFGQELDRGVQRFQDGMRDFQQRMQDWSRGPKDHPAPQPPQFNQPGPGSSRPEGDHKGPPRGHRPEGDTNNDGSGGGKNGAPPEGRGVSTQTSTSVRVDGDGTAVVTANSNNGFERNVTRKDRTGEYSLRQEGADKVFIARLVDGNEQTFPVTTEEQRKAVPPQLLEKLHELDEVNRRVKGDGPENGPAPQPGVNGRGSSV